MMKRIYSLSRYWGLAISIIMIISILHIITTPIHTYSQITNQYVWGYPGVGRGNLNPFTATGVDSVIAGILYSTSLVWMAPNTTLIPWAAYKWEFKQVSQNLTELYFYIRDNAVWSDGSPITADDYVFTWKSIYLPFNKTLDPFGIWRYVVSVEKISDKVLKFTLARNNSFIFAVVSGRIAVPAKIWGPLVANMTESDFAKLVVDPKSDLLKVTSGPFTLEFYDPNSQAVLKAFKQFFMGSPHIDRFVIKFYESTQALIPAIIKGDIDSAYFSPTDVPTVKGVPGITVEPMPWSNNVFYLWTNNQVYPTSLPEFRIALSLAINRVNLASRAGGGYGIPRYNFFPPIADSWVNPSVNGTNTQYDPNKANQILDSLGFKKGSDGIRVTPNGTRLSFELAVPSISDWLVAAQLIASDLKNIGVEVNIRLVAIPTYVDIRSKGAFIIFFGSRIYSVYSVYDPVSYILYPVFDSKSTAPIGSSTPGTNWARVIDPNLDQLIESAMNTDDPSEYKNYVMKIQELLHTNMYIIPLYSIYDIKVYRSDRIEGIQTGLQTLDTLLSVRVKGAQIQTTQLPQATTIVQTAMVTTQAPATVTQTGSQTTVATIITIYATPTPTAQPQQGLGSLEIAAIVAVVIIVVAVVAALLLRRK